MACKNFLLNRKSYTITYLSLGNISNAIQHLASIHGIIDKNKVYMKIINIYLILNQFY